jgi:hypothetical protein
MIADPSRAFHITKGGRPVIGPWNPQGMLNPTSVDLDAQGRVWVIEEPMWPKRVSVWTAQGEFVRDYIGPATYGGMGAAADNQRLVKLRLDRRPAAGSSDVGIHH